MVLIDLKFLKMSGQFIECPPQTRKQHRFVFGQEHHVRPGPPVVVAADLVIQPQYIRSRSDNSNGQPLTRIRHFLL
jgi:hypothetical protein